MRRSSNLLACSVPHGRRSGRPIPHLSAPEVFCVFGAHNGTMIYLLLRTSIFVLPLQWDVSMTVMHPIASNTCTIIVSVLFVLAMREFMHGYVDPGFSV